MSTLREKKFEMRCGLYQKVLIKGKTSKQTSEMDIKVVPISVFDRRIKMSTPERTGRYSSRLSTPRSRRRSRTPVGTPSRRRATIVSASLVTPRRNRKVTMTPQNTLRMLSRALVRERKEADKDKEQDDQQLDVSSEKNSEPHQPNTTPPKQVIAGSADQGINVRTPEWSINDYGVDVEIGYKTPEYDYSSPVGSAKQSSTQRRQVYSDIAIPEGIIPDEGFLFQEAPDDQPLYELPGSQDQFEEDEDEKPASLRTPRQRAKIARIIEKKRQPTQGPKTNKNLARFSKSSVHKQLNNESYEALAETGDLFMDQISYDLKAYTEHAGKKTIDIKAVYLLFKRQRLCNSVESLLELADEVLPLEDLLEIRRNVTKLE